MNDENQETSAKSDNQVFRPIRHFLMKLQLKQNNHRFYFLASAIDNRCFSKLTNYL